MTSQRRAFLRTAIIVVAIVALHYLGILRPLERVVVKGMTPLGRATVALFHSTRREGASATDLRQRVAELEDRIAVLSVENVRLERSLDTTEEVVRQKDFLRGKKISGTQAQTIARSPDVTSEYIVTDAGKREGVRVGAPAIIHDGVIVGTVLSVDDESSRVLLSTDNRSSFAAVLAENPSAQGSVSGVRGLSLRMDLIPISESIHPGQVVITSGIDQGVPSGLVLGEIDRVEKQQGAILQSASLSPLYAPSRLDTVTILTSS